MPHPSTVCATARAVFFAFKGVQLAQEIVLARPDHAALIEAAVAERFPNLQLYRNSEKFAGGSAYDLSYVNGPTENVMREFVQQFATSGPDRQNPYSDSWSYFGFEWKGQRYRGGHPYINVHRFFAPLTMLAKTEEVLAADPALPFDRAQYEAKKLLEQTDLSALPVEQVRKAIPFASLKKRLQMGVLVRGTYTNGSQRTSAVSVVQTNAIAFEASPGSGRRHARWLRWPRAPFVDISSETEFRVFCEDGSLIASYEILNEAPMSNAA